MLNAMPPRPTILLMGALSTAMALMWWLSAGTRSSAPPLSEARKVGAHISSAHPMALWAGLFTVVAVLLLTGAFTNERHISGVGCWLGAPLMFAYGVCSGWSATQLDTVPFTGLIVFTTLAGWHVLNAIMLLGSPLRRWS